MTDVLLVTQAELLQWITMNVCVHGGSQTVDSHKLMNQLGITWSLTLIMQL